MISRPTIYNLKPLQLPVHIPVVVHIPVAVHIPATIENTNSHDFALEGLIQVPLTA